MSGRDAMRLLRFDEMRTQARSGGSGRVAVAMPHDEEAIGSILAAARQGMAEPVLVGDRSRIERAAAMAGETLGDWDVVPAGSPEEAAAVTVEMVRSGKADVVMKGSLETATLLKAILDPEHGLRTGRVLSHVAAFSPVGYPRLLLVTDAAMNIAPTVEQKREIILNAVEVSHALGVSEPRVALLCAKEKVDPRMPATVEAGKIRALWEAGEIPGCIVSGPLALDNAVSPRAAELKGISDPVAGVADVLIAPDIEAANILYKALAFLGGAENAGIILGATAPIVLTSRADSLRSRIDSIALAAIHARFRRRHHRGGPEATGTVTLGR